MTEKELRGFEDLECYQLGLQVFKEAYRVAGLLPLEEKFNLSMQMRRSATSLLSNIAEGYGRYHYLDCLRFYYIARGPLMETLSNFIACREIGYDTGNLEDQRELCHHALRTLNGYIRFIRNQQQGRQEYGDHTVHEIPLSYSIALPILEEDQSTNLLNI